MEQSLENCLLFLSPELQEELPRERGDEREVELDGEGPQPGHGSG